MSGGLVLKMKDGKTTFHEKTNKSIPPPRVPSPSTPPPPPDVQPTENVGTFERKSTADIMLRPSRYNLEILLKAEDSVVPFEWERQNRGILALRQLTKEGNSRSGHSRGRRGGGHSSNVALVMGAKDAFIPTQMLMDAELWDETSEEAFGRQLHHDLNRLVEANIKATATTICQSIDSAGEEHRQARLAKVCSILVEKGSNERAYSLLYARLIKVIDRPEIKERIITIEESRFEDWVTNPGTNEIDEQRCSGHGTFYSSLAQIGLMTETATREAFDNLVNVIVKAGAGANPHHIVMLKSFVSAGDRKVAGIVNQARWDDIYRVSQRTDIPRRLAFHLSDIIEMKDEWLNGGKSSAPTGLSQQHRRDDAVQVVRNAYSSYQDDERVCGFKLEADEIMSASLQILPDQKLIDASFYCGFVARSLTSFESERGPKGKIATILGSCVKRYVDDRTQSDVPHIWKMFSILLCELIIHRVITKEVAKDVYSKLSDEPLQIENEVTWYIYDTHMFTEAINFAQPEGEWENEIADVLALPARLEDTREYSIRMTRLMAIGIVTSVFAKLRQTETQGLSEIEPYYPYLREAKRLRSAAFDEALEREMNGDEPNFTLQEFLTAMSETA